jgi:hypothetical protein
MPAFTSVKSGYWNDPTVWDRNAVPANNDSVTIAAGHTVTFNVDQSSFANGLAGLTINGTLKIPSKAEDPSMPDTVVLKVNANIAGSGSFIIGSPTQPITHPQLVRILVNGTITVATFNAYGEQRSPLWDYLAQDAAAGATTIVLQSGLPLRAGDQIAIGRSDISGSWSESSTARGLHTVASYNAATKTVTLNEALTHARSGTGVRACLVILLSRQIVISKYGANNVAMLSGSGRTIQGVLFTREAGATVAGGAIQITSSTVTYSSCAIGNHSDFLSTNNTQLNYFTSYRYGDNLVVYNTTNFQASNIAVINANYAISAVIGSASFSGDFTNVHAQNCPFAFTNSSGSISASGSQLTVKNAVLISLGGGAGPCSFTITNAIVVDGNLITPSASATLTCLIDGISWYGFLSNNYTACGQTPGMIVIKNLTGSHSASGRLLTLGGTKADNVVFINCSISSLGSLGDNGVADNKYINCSLSNAFNPIIQNHLSGVSEIINLSTNAYYRPTLRVPSIADQLWTNRILVKGLTVGATSHPKAFEHLFPHGYVKNKWDAATPDYTTFDFLLTQSSFAGQPIWLEYQVFTADPIRVTGTISQLGTDESVKVQIFSAGKEPLYGDTPDFEQTYTSTGDINVNWTPTDKRTWIVRVLAYPQQTTNPITIQNLQVAVGGAGGDGSGGQTYNINVTDEITPSLNDAADIVASLMVTDSLNPTLTDQASLSAQIALSDAINPTLQDIVDVESGTFYNISVSDQITPSLADSVDEQIAVSVSESISPQLQDIVDVESGTFYNISVSDQITPSLADSVDEQIAVSVSESISPQLQDQASPSIQISASETIAPTLQEQVNVTAGGTYHIVEPLDIDITEDELEV